MLWFIRRCLPFLFKDDLRPGAPPQIDDEGGAVGVAVAPDDERPAEAVAPPADAWWAPQGDAVMVHRTAQGDRTIDRDLYDHLVRALDDPNLELPRIPHVAQRALMALRDPNVDYRKLAELIEQDPVVTAEVLRVVNCVGYRGIREVRRLDAAFTRLGQRNLRSVLLGVSCKGLMIKIGGAHRSVGEEVWRRSLAAGVIVRCMAQRVGLSNEDGFLIGLLHDIGMFVVLKVVNEYEKLHGRAVSRGLFDRVSDSWHEHIGMRLADAWNLPDPLPELIGNHHRPPGEDDPLAMWRRLIALADASCTMMGFGPYVPYDFFNLPCVMQLGLTPDEATFELLSELKNLADEALENA